jgi:hypothetical protein
MRKKIRDNMLKTCEKTDCKFNYLDNCPSRHLHDESLVGSIMPCTECGKDANYAASQVEKRFMEQKTYRADRFVCIETPWHDGNRKTIELEYNEKLQQAT